MSSRPSLVKMLTPRHGTTKSSTLSLVAVAHQRYSPPSALPTPSPPSFPLLRLQIPSPPLLSLPSLALPQAPLLSLSPFLNLRSIPSNRAATLSVLVSLSSCSRRSQRHSADRPHPLSSISAGLCSQAAGEGPCLREGSSPPGRPLLATHLPFPFLLAHRTASAVGRLHRPSTPRFSLVLGTVEEPFNWRICQLWGSPTPLPLFIVLHPPAICCLFVASVFYPFSPSNHPVPLCMPPHYAGRQSATELPTPSPSLPTGLFPLPDRLPPVPARLWLGACPGAA